VKKIKDPKYIKWLRFQPCLVCGVRNESVVAHHFPTVLHTRRGNDTAAGSLCFLHHTGEQGVHKYPEMEQLLRIKQRKQREEYETIQSQSSKSKVR